MNLKDSFKLRSQAEIDEEANKKKKEETRQKWLSIERARKEHEKYEIKEAPSWMYIGPLMGLIVSVIAGLIIWLSGDGNETILWWIVGIGLVPLLLLGITSDIDESWKASVVAKRELEEEKSNSRDENEEDFDLFDDSDEITLNGFKYQEGYVYTDSTLSYWIYKLTKFVMGVSTIIFAVLAASLLFMWLGSVSIAPTTIIIILLVLILVKMR